MGILKAAPARASNDLIAALAEPIPDTLRNAAEAVRVALDAHRAAQEARAEFMSENQFEKHTTAVREAKRALSGALARRDVASRLDGEDGPTNGELDELRLALDRAEKDASVATGRMAERTAGFDSLINEKFNALDEAQDVLRVEWVAFRERAMAVAVAQMEHAAQLATDAMTAYTLLNPNGRLKRFEIPRLDAIEYIGAPTLLTPSATIKELPSALRDVVRTFTAGERVGSAMPPAFNVQMAERTQPAFGMAAHKFTGHVPGMFEGTTALPDAVEIAPGHWESDRVSAAA